MEKQGGMEKNKRKAAKDIGPAGQFFEIVCSKCRPHPGQTSAAGITHNKFLRDSEIKIL